MKTKFLKRVLWLVIPLLTMFNSQMYADAFEGFEYFSTSSSYTTQLDWSDDDADLDWRSRYGAVTTSSKRSGSNGFLLRNYKDSGNKGWLVTRTTLQNVTSITYYKKVTNTGVQHKVCYSTDGSNWTNITTGITGTSAWGSQTITVPAAVRASALYFRWEITSTNSTGSNRDLYIDDITFTVDAGSVATPSFNNGTGTYNNDVSVTISCATAGATIHYRTDGTAPTCSTGTTGTSVTISSTGTILKAIACKDGSTDSEVATATYTLKCANPTGLTTGTYLGTQTITLATATNGADIYYTTNGNTPSASSTHYTAPFTVSSTQTIKAIAIKSNYTNSDEVSATYTITPAYTVTWKNQGATITTTGAASGTKPTLPSDATMESESGCGKYTYFYGWAEDEWTGEEPSPGASSTVKVYKTASEMPNVSGDVTYYAVWGDSPGGWTKVSSIAAGDVVIIVCESASREIKSVSTSSSSYADTAVYASTPRGVYPMTVEAGSETNSFSFKNGSNYLTATNGNYLYTTTTKNAASSWGVTFNDGNAIINNKSYNTRNLRYNNSSPRFACYTSDQTQVQIYKQSADANCVTSCQACVKPTSVSVSGDWRRFPGETISLTATPTGGTGTPSYQWQKYIVDTWTDISGAKSATYTKANCTNEDAGHYRCVVTTGTGCSTESDGFTIRVYTLEGKYDGAGSDTSNDITVTSGTTGTATVTLEAGRIYRFKVVDNVDKGFGNEGRILHNESGWNFWSDNANYAYLFTGPAGNYTFTVNTAEAGASTPNVAVAVSYPAVEHPVAGYAYYKNVDGWGSVKLHMWYDGGGAYSDWNDDPVIPNTASICNQTYYYTPLIPSWYNRVIFHNGGGDGQTGNIEYANLAAYSGKYNNKSDNGWHEFATYTITYAGGDGSTGGPMAPHTGLCPGSDQQLTANAFSKAYHTFDSWSDGNGHTYVNQATIENIQSNIDLTAQWAPEQYNITATLTNVTSTTSFPVAYTYTGSAANVTYTFAASSGYRLPDAVTVTGSTYTWDKTTGELTLTGTITGNVSITISGVQTHTVTWKVTGSADDVETYDHGDALVIPSDPSSPPACSDKKFVGWKDGPIDGSTDVRPTMLDPSSPGTVTADKAYYAVFADDNSGSVTITASCMPTTGSDEYKNRSWSATGTDGTEFTGSIYNYKTGSASFMQFKNEGSPFYNITATPSPITKIEMKKYGGTDRNWTPRVSATTVQSTSAMTGGTNLTGQGVTASGASWELDEANEYKYVYLGVNGGTQIEYIKIYYGSSSGYVTECSSCTTPSNLAVGGITSTGGTVTWEGVSLSPTEGFTVAWNTSNSVPSPLTASNSHDVAAGTNEYAITGLTAATQYYVFVKSKCNDAWSSSADFYTNAKITYAAGTGASGSMDPKEVTYNTDAVVDVCTFEAPTGKTFNGWVSDQTVTVGGSSTTSVPDGATISNLTKAITLTAQWRDLAQYHVTFSADNGTVAGGPSQTVTEGGTLTFPNVTSTTCGTFDGWVEAAYDNTAKPTGATYHAAGDELAADPSMEGKTYYAVYKVATGTATTISDVITASDLAATGTSYTDFDNVTSSSSASYKGQSAKNAQSDIQLRATSPAGIVSNLSGGQIKKVMVVWGTGNNSDRKVDIYGKNTAYDTGADLFSNDASVKGTKLGDITEGSTTELTIDGDYEYIGLRSNSGSAYLASITFQWYGAPMKYQTSPVCSPVVGLESSFSAFTYVYNAGPSAAQSFTVSGNNLSANLVVTAPTNYEVSKTENGTYTSSVNYTPTEGTVSSETVYIRLAAGRNVGTYNYAAASGVSVASEGATTRTAALNGSVTQATGAIAFTNFNAVDHYEAEMPAGASGLDVTLTVSVTGDGAVSYSKSPTTGVSPTIPATQPTTTLHVLQTGTWAVTANLAAGTNYTSASTSCQVVVYYADRFYDNIHADVQEYVSITLPIVERGSYDAPDLMDADKGSANCAAKHYKFMGWVSEANITAGLPNDDAYKAVLIPAGTPMTATGTNYYAVWAEDE